MALMAYRLALNFEDGVTRFVDCAAGETVADAAYRAGVNIPLDCRDGACGTCKCRVEAGAYDSGSYIEDALTEEEAARGLALACQMRPKTDCVVDIAASAQTCRTAERSFSGVIRALERLSGSTLRLEVETAESPAFLPGQYVNLGAQGSDLRRSYSFSSAPGEAVLSFLIRDLPQGAMSAFLRERARPGMTLDLSGPMGSFYLRDVRRPLLFLAGGTGLAPFLSMLGKIAETGTGGQPIHMVYGVTNDADLVGVNQLEAYAGRIPGYTFSTVVAAADSAHPRKGYVTAHIEPGHLNGGDVDVYLCGPPPMVEAVRGWLAEQGIAPANFYYEKFSPSGAVTTIGETHRQAA
jgi:benzoate/toluate 1,2-dioxygenase reductase component